jgi:hypothetical protein
MYNTDQLFVLSCVFVCNTYIYCDKIQAEVMVMCLNTTAQLQ